MDYKLLAEKTAKHKEAVKGLKAEFIEFLSHYSVVGVAIGIVIGGAINSLIQSFVAGVITPLLQLLIPSTTFKDFVVKYNGVTFAFGPLINAFINFVIVALLVFLTVKYLLFKGGKIDRTKIEKP